MAPFERDGFHKAECSILLDSVINTARLGTCKLSCLITFVHFKLSVFIQLPKFLFVDNGPLLVSLHNLSTCFKNVLLLLLGQTVSPDLAPSSQCRFNCLWKPGNAQLVLP